MEGGTERREAGEDLGLGLQDATLLSSYHWPKAPDTRVHTQAGWCVLPGLRFGPFSIMGILFTFFSSM